MRLLVGEVNELRNLLEVATLLAKTVYATLLALHNKARLLEGVDVAIYGTIGGAESLRHILHGVVVVACHHLHQTQHTLNFGLVHRSILLVKTPLLPTKL